MPDAAADLFSSERSYRAINLVTGLRLPTLSEAKSTTFAKRQGSLLTLDNKVKRSRIAWDMMAHEGRHELPGRDYRWWSGRVDDGVSVAAALLRTV
jgi:hypothetical protein